MTCEYKNNPVGIDVAQPLLGWIAESTVRGDYQTAYEIIVSDNPDKIEKLKGNIWNSGKVKSAECNNIEFKGKAEPIKRYYWKVRTYNKNGKSGEWSKTAFWDMALLAPDQWKAQWIYDGSKTPEKTEDFYENDPAPMFRKDVVLNKAVASAKLLISGLGYFETYINGKKINDNMLEPGWTSYDKRIPYTMTDVTDLLRNGNNTLGVMLGNGFYNPVPMAIFRPLREYLMVGRPAFIAMLHIKYTDGSNQTVPTDNGWKTAPGPVIRNNVYLGEHYDARKEIEGWNLPGTDTSPWKQAVVRNDLSVKHLRAQIHPPVKVTATLDAKRMSEVRPGEFIYDLGQNFAGVVKLKVRGKRGSIVKIRYGEDVYSDGSLNVMTSVAGQQKKVWDADRSLKGQPQTAWQEDLYIKKSDNEETWSPRFTFHGFRYVELTGDIERPVLTDIEGLRMSADMKTDGTFTCDNEMINKLEKNIEWTFLSNMFSVQSDCPAREKLGYGGDIVGTVDAFCYKFDMHNFYSKSVYDYADAARESGAMTETAPYVGIADLGFGEGSGPIGWQLAFGLMQKKIYDYYGNKRIITENYETLKKQVEFLRLQAKENIIDHCISDHESLDQRPGALTATAHYYHHIILLAEFANILNKGQDAQTYSKLAEAVKQSFHQKFYKGNGVYDNFTQSSQSFAVYYNMMPASERDKVFAKLIETIEKADGHVRSGIFGVPATLNSLVRNNHNNIAYEMVAKTDFPGWGFMINRGATTLWETWAYSDNTFSQNHPMFGSVNEWFYRGLLGINGISPGFADVEIKPQPVPGLKKAQGSYNSVRGPISVAWEQSESKFTAKISIPYGVSAVIKLPAKGELFESGKPAAKWADIKIAGTENGFTVIKAGSGHYEFTVTE